MSDEVRAKLTTNAQGPRSVETDGLRVTNHSLADQIAADRHLSKAQNATNSKLPVRIGKFKSGGPAS